MTATRFVPLLCAVALFACEAGEGAPCDPANLYSDCSSSVSWDCASCEKFGFSKAQGYCTLSGPYAKEATCQQVWNGSTDTDTARDGRCTGSYEGPLGDPQVATQCQSVWNYRCNARNESAADQNCRVYDSMEPTVSCPYCD